MTSFLAAASFLAAVALVLGGYLVRVEVSAFIVWAVLLTPPNRPRT
jgi:hypothetical protein